MNFNLTDQSSLDNLKQVRISWLENRYDKTKIKNYFETISNHIGGNSFLELLKELDKLPINFDIELLAKDEFFNIFALVAYHTIELLDYDASILYLNDLLKYHSNNIFLNYETGFVKMQQGRFSEALGHFELIAKIKNSFDNQLNKTLCNIYIKNSANYQKEINLLKNLISTEEDKAHFYSIKLMTNRLSDHHFTNKKKYTNRDWLYILYGNIILNDTINNKVINLDDPKELKKILLEIIEIKNLFENFKIQFDSITYVDDEIIFLADLFELIFEIPLKKHYHHNFDNVSLLIKDFNKNSNELYQFAQTLNKNDIVYCYDFNPHISYPIIPNVINQLSQVKCFNTLAKYNKANFINRARSILTNLDNDISNTFKINNFVDYYKDKFDYLTINEEPKINQNFSYMNELKFLGNNYD